LRLLPLLVLLVLAAGALGAFALSRQVMADQEDRLLAQRAAEVQALLASSIDSIDSSLRVLGPIGASPDPAAMSLFAQSAGRLVEGSVATVVVAAEDGEGFAVTAAVGEGAAVDERLAPERAALASRARGLDEPQLVADLITEGGETRLVLARPVAGTRAVAYQESVVDPTTPASSTSESPFRELRVALYASPEVDPERLVVTTEAALPLTGRVERVPFSVGADRWLLAVGTRGPLVGSLAKNIPWLFLAGGLVTAVLAAAIIETLARRGTYALALVAERTGDLEHALGQQRDAQQMAEDANRAKSEFLSRMSHELRTPLNAVLGFGQLLETDDLTDSQRDAVDHVLKGGRHLLDLINEVLDISRIEAGELSLSPEPVLAAELVGEAVDLMRPLADQRGIQLVVDSSGVCDCYVFADRQRAKQVMLNLLSNAIKYNRPRGSVAVSCEQPDATRLRISVADTGTGIPAERLGQLFIPFERLGAEHTREEGTGIGLALSKRLAEAMGGTLSAASTLGQGSTFTVELPRVEGPVERYERLNSGTQPAAEPTARRQVVLHIEDNLSNLTLVERVLAQRPGIEVVAAMHGRLGLELAREHHPLLVLLDLHLPDMGGEQVLQRLRDDPTTAFIPVVIVSADATPGQIQRLLSAGAAGYLTKPIDVRELLRLVDDAVADP
jgi:signal transduction histidine kinase/ActR/RegA family two-component response regulator